MDIVDFPNTSKKLCRYSFLKFPVILYFLLFARRKFHDLIMFVAIAEKHLITPPKLIKKSNSLSPLKSPNSKIFTKIKNLFRPTRYYATLLGYNIRRFAYYANLRI